MTAWLLLTINRESVDWYKFVQSDTYQNFRFIRYVIWKTRQAMSDVSSV